MARVCKLTGKAVQSGNNVSHSNRRTRRRFLPNLHNFSLQSDILGRSINMRISNHAMRSVEANGGLDNYLLSTSDDKLTTEALKIKHMIKKASKK